MMCYTNRRLLLYLLSAVVSVCVWHTLITEDCVVDLELNGLQSCCSACSHTTQRL